MMKKVVVIISNELENNIPLFVVSCDQLHYESIREFIFQNDISIPLNKMLSSQELSFALAEQGFCVLLGIEEQNKKDLVAFMPTKISSKQYEYFEKRKKGFESYDFAFFICSKDNKHHVVDKTTFQGNILEEFFKFLNQKKITPDIKVKKKVNNL